MNMLIVCVEAGFLSNPVTYCINSMVQEVINPRMRLHPSLNTFYIKKVKVDLESAHSNALYGMQ